MFSLRDNKDASLGEEVRKERYLSCGTHKMAFFNPDILFLAVLDEVEDTQEMEVWGIVPLVGQGPCHRCSASEEYLEPRIDMGKIGDADDDFSADSQGFLQDGVGFFDLLEALIQDNDIEGFILVLGETAVDVVLKYTYTSLYAFQYGFTIDFNALGLHALITYQPGKELPVATAKVQDRRRSAYESSDDGAVCLGAVNPGIHLPPYSPQRLSSGNT